MLLEILIRYNLLGDTYHVIIGLACKFLLTLPVTQVTCERRRRRSFSTLKFIKSRLRSTLTREYLQDFMLMAAEKSILMTFDNEVIIDKVQKRVSCSENCLFIEN